MGRRMSMKINRPNRSNYKWLVEHDNLPKMYQEIYKGTLGYQLSIFSYILDLLFFEVLIIIPGVTPND